ncbi:hypothetical protein RZS28_13670 [Methylocapsa polymorpha]|uniref:Uncharacterized protein n=1 Tax=Methylocapsa polymorpha TaxID=3080828 RepID=A0ABZ0HR03_9HYPH|nr:hypothetical protein RZS28_13670 [Methylocapsa sp. RX1]
MLKPNMLTQLKMGEAGRGFGAPTSAGCGPVECAGTDAGAQSTALYIAQMTGELARLAHFGRLGLLTHLLEMARLEAEICCLPERTPQLPSNG